MPQVPNQNSQARGIRAEHPTVLICRDPVTYGVTVTDLIEAVGTGTATVN